ncbi:MAG TPA: ThuA domain-containing protein [Gemmataceae bacterium]|jgi:type 1 glutamine amidotransferase|nr:ThuA domain-containing protein [Gemmataceae bacterium]
MFRWLPFLALGLLALPFAVRADDPPDDPKHYDQSSVPLEVDSPDPKLNKIVLLAGRQSHGPGDHEFFAGCVILMKMLKETPGVWPMMARDGWPKNEKIFDGAKAVVFYMDGGGGHPIIARPEHAKLVSELTAKGVGFVNLHYAVEYPAKFNQDVFGWLGGYYETGFSTNPHWDADFKTLPEHPITRGVKPFKIRDEWYYNIRFRADTKGVTPILEATPPDNTRGTAEAKKHPGRLETVAWAYERPEGGRSFGFTGGHTHKNWGDENFRRLVTNAILWSAKLDVPPEGAKVDFDLKELNWHMDQKGFGKPKK